MTSNTIGVLAAIIPAVVSIIGFIVTYNLTKRNVLLEIQKQKSNILLDKMSSLPLEIQETMNIILKSGSTTNTIKKFESVMGQIFAYGTKEAIMIISSMQELIYQNTKDSNTESLNKVFAYFVLLICQIKYDLTGIEINPEHWYKMRITDYSETKEIFGNANNEIIKNLELPQFMMIKYD